MKLYPSCNEGCRQLHMKEKQGQTSSRYHALTIIFFLFDGMGIAVKIFLYYVRVNGEKVISVTLSC
jgi:hypothetical protein